MARSRRGGSMPPTDVDSSLTRSESALQRLLTQPERIADALRPGPAPWVPDLRLSDHWSLPPGQDVLRSTDFLALRVQLVNLRALAAPGGGAVLDATRKDAFVVLHFPPQSIAERVYYQVNTRVDESDGHLGADGTHAPPQPPSATSESPHAPPIRSRIANWSHLVFRWDEAALAAAGLASVPYTLAGLLAACQHLPLAIAPNARRLTPFQSIDALRFDRLSAAQRRSVALMSPASRAELAVSMLRNRQLLQRHAGAVELVLRRAEAAPAAEGATRRIPPALRDSTLAGLAASSALEGAVYELEPVTKIRLRVRPRPARPRVTQTALELPYRLILSPNETARWKHAIGAAAFEPTGHAELWHTRLGRADDAGTVLDGPGSGTELRAIWARVGPDSQPERFNAEWPSPNPEQPQADTKPFRMTLDDRDRFNIVHLSGNFALRGGRHEALDCRRLMLSSLGGWLDSRGAWHVPDGLSVEEWSHRATQARDHFVRVVYKGYLFPWGHRVSLVKVSERKFHPDRSGNPAYLRQRMFMVVREFVRDYPADVGHRDNRHFHRQFPFARIRLTTVTTPDIEAPSHPLSDIRGQAMFWPVVGAGRYRFHMIGTDLDGVESEFDMPAIFIDNSLANPLADAERADNFEAAKTAWNGAPAQDRTADLARQRVAFAVSRKPGDTVCEVQSMQFGAESSGLSASWTANGRNPICFPSMTRAEVRVPALAYLAGGGAHALTYNAAYLSQKSGFGAGEVFADLSGAGLDFSRQGNRSGGLVQPNLAPCALSRLSGPVAGTAGPDTFGSGSFDPKTFFGSLSPLLFGCIPLGELIQGTLIGDDTLGEIPKFLAETASVAETFLRDAQQVLSLCQTAAAAPADALLPLALQAARAAFDSLAKQALDDLNQRLKSLDGGTLATLQPKLVALQGTLTPAAHAVAAALADFGNGAALPAALAGVKLAVDELLAAIGLRSGQLPGAGLPQAVVAVARQWLDEARSRIGQLQALFADLQKIPPLLGRAQALATALAPFTDPATLKGLLDGSGTPTLKDALEALDLPITALGDAFATVRLLDGSVRQGALTLLAALRKAVDAADTLAPLIESLLGDEIVVRFDWKPRIKSWPEPAGTLGTLFRPHDERGFAVAVEARAKKSGGAPEAKVSCSLSRFDLILLGTKSGFLELAFDKVEFRAQSSLKMDVDVVFNELRFIGVLAFVETLKDLVPLDGFSDPPALDISEQGIDASFSVALPNIAIGVLSLSNLSLGAGFTIPFIGQPLAVRFNFCSREQPFNLIVSMFGGGGFFGVTVDPRGVQVLEASFEFGAAIAIDLGVASGGVSVMAGIYYRMELDEASLTGYLRLAGHVDVLGIASASIELYLDLTYEFDSGKCVGQATITVEISVLVFSGSVTIGPVRRQFAGSNGDPSLAALMGPAANEPLTDQIEYPWRRYCEAFAA